MSKTEEPKLAEEAEFSFFAMKKMHSLSTSDMRREIDKLHMEVKRIKKAGVTMWNFKEVLPKIFDIVDGSFVAMKEVVDKQGEIETRLDALEKK